MDETPTIEGRDVDLTALTDEELNTLYEEVRDESARRAIPRQMAMLNRSYLEGGGQESGDPWVQPKGAYDAYPIGWVVSHNDKTWESLVDGNVWEPGVSGWRESVAEGGYPSWVQPTGAHDSYGLGAEVTHNSLLWRSTMDSNVWEPGVMGWDEFQN